MSRLSRFAVSITLVMTTGCMTTTDCDCVIPSTGLDVFGLVTAGGAPLANAVVRARVAPGACQAGAEPTPTDIGEGHTAIDGSYDVMFGTTRTGPACLIVTATKFTPGEVTGTRRIDVTLPSTLGDDTQRIQADLEAAAR